MSVLLKKIISILIMILLLYGGINIVRSAYLAEYDELKISLLLLAGIFLTIILALLSILLHELGHGITSVILGYRIEMFCTGSFEYINNKKKKFFINRSNILNLSGFVIPSFSGKISNENNYNDFVKDLRKFILGGILVTISIIIISSFLIIIDKFTAIAMILLLVNWPLIIDALDNKDGRYGDLFVLNYLKKNPKDAIFMISNNFTLEYPASGFLINKLEERTNFMLKNHNYNLLVIEGSDKLLREYIISSKGVTKELGDLRNWLINNYSKSIHGNAIYKLILVKVIFKFILLDIRENPGCDYRGWINIVENITKSDFKMKHYKVLEESISMFKKSDKVIDNDLINKISFEYELFKHSEKYQNSQGGIVTQFK